MIMRALRVNFAMRFILKLPRGKINKSFAHIESYVYNRPSCQDAQNNTELRGGFKFDPAIFSLVFIKLFKVPVNWTRPTL